MSVYELPDHQDQDASLRWARRRSRLKGVSRMKQTLSVCGRTGRAHRTIFTRIFSVAALGWCVSVGAPSAVTAGPSGVTQHPGTATERQGLHFIDSQSWYEGGTLHNATLRSWQRGSSRNQLATAADWAVHILGRATVYQIGMSGVRLHANNLVICINRAATPAMLDQPVSELAAACAILLEM